MDLSPDSDHLQFKAPLILEITFFSQTNTQKDLGVVVNNNLKWSSHIISSSSKTNQILGLLYRSSDPHFGMSVKHSLYLSLVRSYLGYADDAWMPLRIGGLRTIEGVQRQATKYILGYPDALIPYKERFIKLNLLPVLSGMKSGI